MRTVSLRLVDMARAVIPIGLEGENEFTTVRIDCKKMLDQHPGAIPSLTVKDPAGNIYPAVVTLDGTIAEWRVTASDLTRKGDGEIQLSFAIDESIIGKSDPAKTIINRSIESNGQIPEPIQNWIDEANIILGEIPVTIAESVDTALEAAKESGEFDGEDGVSPEVTVTTITGGHRIVISDAEGDHPFEVLDGEDGDPGHTPVITASKSGSTTTIMVDGVAIVQISDGQEGDPGHSPVVTASKSGKVTTISVDGTPIATINDGLDGDPTALIDDTAGSGTTGKTWSADKIAAEKQSLLTEINSANDAVESLALNGYFVEGGVNQNIELSIGMIYQDKSINPTETGTGYVKLSDAQESVQILFDNTKYKCNLAYFNGNTNTQWTSWITSPPLIVDPSVSHTEIYVNVRKLSGTMSADDLNTALYYVDSVNVGNLATRQYVDQKVSKGEKCIFPDSFVSRIKPDIYFNGAFYADIDINSYKLIGTGEVWVATNGNDSTGTGEEDNPYATITKALSVSAKTIHLKEGTYTQDVHYSKWVEIQNVNLIGHGNVILQNDSVGHSVIFRGNNYVENITFKHGHATLNPAVSANCTGLGETICFVGCTFRDGGENGLSVYGIDVVIANCISYGNKLDGFNYHKNTLSDVVYVPNVLEMNCVAYNNGSDQSGSNSCNGSTSHDGTKIIRLNGDYYSCYGGIIADIGEGEDPTISVNYGVTAHDGTGEDVRNASFWASTDTKMYLYDCFSYGSTYDITAENNGYVVSRRLTTGRDVPSVSEASGATVLQY